MASYLSGREDFVRSYLTTRRRGFSPVNRHKETSLVYFGCGDRDLVMNVIEYLAPLLPFGVDLELGPGGPRRMYRDIMDPDRLELSVAEVKFYVEKHGCSSVVLSGHTKCGRYNHSRRNGRRNLSSDELDERVKQHLLKLRGALRTRLPKVETYLLFIGSAFEDGIEYPDFIPL